MSKETRRDMMTDGETDNYGRRREQRRELYGRTEAKEEKREENEGN